MTIKMSNHKLEGSLTRRADVAELIQVAHSLRVEGARVRNQLAHASQSMKNITNSQSLRGETGRAVDEGIHNVHVPILEALEDVYLFIAQDFEKMVRAFQDHMGDTSDNAIFDTMALYQAEQLLQRQGMEKGELDEEIRRIYQKIADIAPDVRMPSSRSFDNQLESTENHLRDTRNQLGTFDANLDQLEGFVHEIEQKIRSFGSVSGLAYADPARLSVLNDSTFRDAAATFRRETLEREMLLFEKNANRRSLWATQTPYETAMGLERPMTKEELEAFERFIGSLSRHALEVTTELLPELMETTGEFLSATGQGFVALPNNRVVNISASLGDDLVRAGRVAGPVASVTGFGVGMYQSLVLDNYTIGEAVAYNGLDVVVGGAASAIVKGAFLLAGVTPVGWAVVGVGLLFSFGFSLLYEHNILGVQDGTRALGGWIDDSLQQARQSIDRNRERMPNPWTSGTYVSWP